MAAFQVDSHAGGHRMLTPRLIILALCLGLLASLPGCGGCSCRKAPKTQEELDREKAEAELRARLEREKKKPPLEVDWLVSQPHEPKAKACWYKPGHWTAATFPAKANHDDILADLEVTITDPDGRPLGLSGAAYTFSSVRTIALPKKQPKQFDTKFLVPAMAEKARAAVRITSKNAGQRFEAPFQPLMAMPPHQYYCVVLARWPERYTYLEKLDTFTAPAGFALDPGDRPYYRVELLRAEKETTLPAHTLFWTSIACILWDDAEPDALSLEQQTALVDWLHWGGQLLVSGPESLDALKDSFLAPYLPATSSGTRQIATADLAEIDARWTPPIAGYEGPGLKPVRSWAGVSLQLQEGARVVPGTGGLLAERRVGRGRVVVSAFALNGRELIGWTGFDSFFNTVLMAHPPRAFQDRGGETLITWANGPPVHDDAGRLSNLRYFARDTGRKVVVNSQPQRMAYPMSDFDQPRPVRLNSDVASWNDQNQVADAARESLEQAARIEIPKRGFVVWVVAAYLVVLVPLNWIVFRLIGRVEWAWVAAPVIAVACTVVVIRLAQLDIGFARSTTEIAVVEFQGDHSRAHVARYLALYTSLSTPYAFHFDDPGAMVLPLAVAGQAEAKFGRTNLRYRYGQDVALEGLHILSNSTGMAHSEQMLDLGGGISLRQRKDGGYELFNGSDLALHGAGLMRKTEDRLEVAWLGDVGAGVSQPVRLREHPVDSENPLWEQERSSHPITADSRPTGSLGLRQLLSLAERPDDLRPGDVRLVAWTDQPLPGMEVRPAAPQARQAAVVVAHLHYGHPPDPQPDVNARADVDLPYRRTLLSQ